MDHLRIPIWSDHRVTAPEEMGMRTVTVPVLTWASGPFHVEHWMVEEHGAEMLARVEADLRRELDERLAEVGLRLVEEPRLVDREDPMENAVEYRLMAHVADAWEDGAWATARAAVQADQRWLEQHRAC